MRILVAVAAAAVLSLTCRSVAQAGLDVHEDYYKGFSQGAYYGLMLAGEDYHVAWCMRGELDNVAARPHTLLRYADGLSRLGDDAGDRVARVEATIGVLEHRLHGAVEVVEEDHDVGGLACCRRAPRPHGDAHVGDREHRRHTDPIAMRMGRDTKISDSCSMPGRLVRIVEKLWDPC